MKIIIPMTGHGSRFVAAGYDSLKPFIKVMEKPIIEWIVKGMFPGESKFLFICRKEHIQQYPWMEEYLLSLASAAEVFIIDDWLKKGPVYDVLRAADKIDDTEPCIINYCDFFVSWDWGALKNQIKERDCKGCIPCYTGFHPHLTVSENVYASCLTDNDDNLLEIREKYSFEEDKMKAKHSSGIYYFRSGELLKKYCRKLIDSGESIFGEFYASMVYNFMVEDQLDIWVPTDIKYFCQWGTPQDMEESVYWLEMIRRLD